MLIISVLLSAPDGNFLLCYDAVLSMLSADFAIIWGHYRDKKHNKLNSYTVYASLSQSCISTTVKINENAIKANTPKREITYIQFKDATS